MVLSMFGVQEMHKALIFNYLQARYFPDDQFGRKKGAICWLRSHHRTLALARTGPSLNIQIEGRLAHAMPSAATILQTVENEGHSNLIFASLTLNLRPI
jgi:hypothetical protein